MEELYKIKQPVSGFTLRHLRYETGHLCDGSAGIRHSVMGYVLSGCSDIELPTETLRVKKGDLFYLPRGTRYRSAWRGEPEIEYIILHIEGDEMIYRPRVFERVSEMSVLKIEYALKEEDTAYAMSSFYGLYGAIVPLLQADKVHTESPVLKSAKEYLERHLSENISIPDICKSIGVSESTLYHIFKTETGTTPVGYRNELRLQMAAEMIREGAYGTESIGERVGFSSSVHFRECFKKYFGMTPTKYKRVTNEKGN